MLLPLRPGAVAFIVVASLGSGGLQAQTAAPPAGAPAPAAPSPAAPTVTAPSASAPDSGAPTPQPAPAPAPPVPAPVAPNPTVGSGPTPPPGTPATVVDADDASAILGKSVRSTAGEDMGRVVDVIVMMDGSVRAAVIDFGGFLGVGSRKIAVDWRAMGFSPDGKTGRITLALTRNQVRLSPEYKAGEPIVILGAGAPQTDPATVAQRPRSD